MTILLHALGITGGMGGLIAVMVAPGIILRLRSRD